MNAKVYFSKATRLQEILTVALLGWIPFAPGRIIRRIAYRSILGRIGVAARIETGVTFIHANQIELGREARLDQNVCIRNMGRNSKVYIGNQAALSRGVNIKVHAVDGGRIEIGDRSALSPHCWLSGKSITIGKDCLLAHYVAVFANNHAFSDPTRPIREQGHTYQGIVIEDDCWLGTGVKVLDGVTIGRGSVIGAGAVVTKDIPPYSIAVGVPAKVVSQRGKETMHECLNYSQSAYC